MPLPLPPPSKRAIYLNPSNLPSQQLLQSIIALPTQPAFDLAYNFFTNQLDHFFPSKVITMTSSDPQFYTPEIKFLLRQRNSLMRSGKSLQANALTAKIGKLIMKADASQLSNLTSRSSSQ